MFLCSECHKDCGCIAIGRSAGHCEGCGQAALCVDCHTHRRIKRPASLKTASIDPATGRPVCTKENPVPAGTVGARHPMELVKQMDCGCVIKKCPNCGMMSQEYWPKEKKKDAR